MYSPTPSSKEAEQRKLAMAGDLDGGEFWLPPQFLTEEEILMGFDTNSSAGFNSELGSPVDSVTETESDDDEFVSGLTHHMALSSLLPDSPNNNITNPKGWVLSGSPQSTLCPVGGGGISSRGRPTGRTSPPAVSDAGVSAKKGTGYFDSSNRGKQSTPVSALNSQNPDFQFQQLWSQELMNQRRKGQRYCQWMGPPASTWHAVQRPANRKPHPAAQNLSGSGMRAVFLGSTGSKRESVGTGVFLPRSVNPVEPRKKTNKKNCCATVLVPEKVVQALKNINGPRIVSQSRLVDSSGDDSLDIRLPSEWTY